MKWQDCVSSTLSNTGGEIKIKEKGNYEITAVMYDTTSTEFLGKASFEVLPITIIDLEMEAATHTDTAVTVKAEVTELGDYNVVWSLLKDEVSTLFEDVTTSEITNNGGAILFNEKGNYKVIATVTDKTDRVYTQSVDTVVYPVAEFVFEAPKTTYTDTECQIEVTSSELQDMVAEWTIFKDGKIIPPAMAIKGNLSNTGGAITFIDKGDYTLKATLFDELGREYTHEKSIVVYPVAETGFFLPATTHTDSYVEVKTDFKEIDGMEVVWSVTENEKSVSLTNAFYGTLTNDGGHIKFKEVGSYTLQATVTDKVNRTFTFDVDTTVYPVIEIETTLPAYTHTDRSVKVLADTTIETELPLEWAFEKDKVAIEVENTLNNDGGMLSIKNKGNFVVIATITDETGRVFKSEKDFKVYPVPTMGFEIPKAAHTDDTLPIVASSTDTESINAEWYVDNTHGFQDWETYVDGTLVNTGGDIRFKRAGVYNLQARVTDEVGRVFRFNSNNIEVLPILSLSFELPNKGYTDTDLEVRTRGNNAVLPVEWSLMKDGIVVSLGDELTGELNAFGGKISFNDNAEYRLTATMFDALGRIFTASEQISIYPLYNCEFIIPTTIRAGEEFVIDMSDDLNLTSQNVVWSATKNGANIVIDDYVDGTISNTGGTVSIINPADYTLTATITDELGRIFTDTNSISVVNTAPTIPIITAEVTRTSKDGKLLVKFDVVSTDKDGDTIIHEYQNNTQDSYYAVGSHTVKVRAKDNYGGISNWGEVTFIVNNEAPTRPIITRTPNTNSVVPGTKVTITASSTDSDGDEITYVWENRASETTTYPLGKNTVRVKAVDSTGAESPWAAITFFVMDNNGSGGMMLTGPSSTIDENGIEDATITKYTFTVPPVSGHSGKDYGRVKGYNIKTQTWDQLSYGTTINGISFTKELEEGIYSKLEMYYYTNHNCMYNKSNITYTVEYYFE